MRAAAAGRITGALALLLLTVPTAPVAAQRADVLTGPTRAEAATGGYRAVAAAPQPWSTVVAITVAFPAGSSVDPEGREGTTFLLGEAIRRSVLGAVEEGAAEMVVEVDRSHTVFRILTIPERWPAAFRALEAALFDAEVSAGDFESARASLQEVFTFERGAPVREFQTEVYRLIAGADDPWSRSPRGSSQSLDEVALADVRSVRSEHFRKAQGVVTLTGAVDAERVFRLVADGPAPPKQGTGPLVVAVDGGRVQRAGDEAWNEGDRIVLDREVTNHWLAVAWPVDPETPRSAVEMLAHRLDDILNTTPPDPGLFSARVRIEDMEGRTVLLTEAAVLPEAAAQWEERILRTMDALEADEAEPVLFRWQRRRFRSARLMAETAPEEQGLRMAMDLLREGRIRDLPSEIRALDPNDLQEAADDLGPPRILVFGPDLSDTSQR